MTKKNICKKRFHDLEKEESWLNEMSEKGLVLKNVKCGIFRDEYIFEHCDKKYVCRIDYNPEMEVLDEITSPYTMFVTGTYEAEFICCANGKLYFRKAEESGEFPPIYTSIDSRIAAEKKQIWRNIPLLIIVLIDIFFIGSDLLNGSNMIKLSTVCFVIAILLSIPTAAMFLRHIFKMRKLKKLRDAKGSE